MEIINKNLNVIVKNINDKNFEKAYSLLGDIKEKCESWYYLNSISSMNLGYYLEAKQSIKNAIDLNPQNDKYKKLLDSYNFYRDDYERRSYGYKKRRGVGICCCDDCCCCCDDCCCCLGDDCCENIGKLWCLDSMCECFGGDIVDCF